MTRSIKTTTIQITSSIKTTQERLFDAITNIENLPATNADIISVKFLTEKKIGVGTKFVETRANGGKKVDTELEITEYVPFSRVRMVADSHGTEWDTVFIIQERNGNAELTLTMNANAHAFLPRVLNPIMKGLYKKGVEKHVSALKIYCENRMRRT